MRSLILAAAVAALTITSAQAQVVYREVHVYVHPVVPTVPTGPEVIRLGDEGGGGCPAGRMPVYSNYAGGQGPVDCVPRYTPRKGGLAGWKALTPE